MSFRYPNGSYISPGLNTLVAPTPVLAPFLYGWGRNNSGQLGLGNTTDYSSPKQVGLLSNWSAISSSSSTISIKTDGTLWAWGGNYYGQLGLGNRTYYSSPKQVGSGTNWSKIANSYQVTLAIKTDGTLWSWGNNNFGQLGLGNTNNYSSPKQVGSLTNWLQISAGYNSCAAIKTDGTLWMWGNGGSGQLGQGNTNNYSSPKQIGALTNWLQVSTNYSSLAVKTDGTLWAWGYNVFGALGFGNATGYSSPKQVGTLTNWAYVDTRTAYSTIAIKTDGTIWSWGRNGDGNLGLGNRTNYSSPKQIGALTNWSKVVQNDSFGSNHVLSIKTDGTLWAWGLNAYGQLGLNNQTSYSSPKQVGSLTDWLNVAAGYFGNSLTTR